jgi:hypothetical protein
MDCAKTVSKRYEIEAKGVLLLSESRAPNLCKAMECMVMNGRNVKRADCWQS